MACWLWASKEARTSVPHVAARDIDRGHHRGAESRRSSLLSAPGLAIGNPCYQRQKPGAMAGRAVPGKSAIEASPVAAGHEAR